jgi:hypothetical protein
LLEITDLWGRYLPQADVRDEINGGAINAKISNVACQANCEMGWFC